MSTLVSRDLKSVWHPFTPQIYDPPRAIVRGEGSKIYDEEGRSYIDAISSWWVNTHGHAHPYISQKIAEQLPKLHQVIFAGFTHEPAVTLAERLLAKLPINQKKIFYSDDGSTAVEVALKMAIQYWFNQGKPRHRIVALQGGYHGDTFGAMAAGEKDIFIRPFSKFLFHVDHIPVPVDDGEASYQALEKLIAEDEVIAFIYEPLVQGAAGMAMYKPEHLQRLLTLCHERGVITIADEVMTGFFRTGRWFASEHVTEKPDIMCLSKGLTGGTLALGATSCSSKVYEAFLSEEKEKIFFHSHSFTANPIACAAAVASLDLFEDPILKDRISSITKFHQSFLSQLEEGYPSKVANLRQQGTICAFDLTTEKIKSYLNARIYNFGLDRGVLLRPLGNVAYILPPYCITASELQQIYETLFAMLEEFA